MVACKFLLSFVFLLAFSSSCVQGATWNTTAPVATNNTCNWTTDSMCSTSFFSANGKYNESWSGSVYFSDLTPSGGILETLTVQLFGSFQANMTGVNITLSINNNTWGIWQYQNDYKSNCAAFTDSVIITGTGNLTLLPGVSNLLTFSVPLNGPEIYACGAVISGDYVPPSPSTTPTATSTITSTPTTTPTPSNTPTIGPTPTKTPVALQHGTWNTTAPVETQGTCNWTSTSTCTTEFFSASGEYNSTWSGSVYFSDLTPAGATLNSLTVQLFGSFESATTSFPVTVTINNVTWTTWTYGTDYQFDCTSATDSVTLTGPPVGSLVSGNSNLLAFVVPSGSPQIFACGAIVSGNFVEPISTTPTVTVTPISASPTTIPSPSSIPPATTSTWSTTAPVETQGTCNWTSTSTCTTEFFSASGEYNSTWSGSVYFSDLTPAGATLNSLTVQLFGSFEPGDVSSPIVVMINDIEWTTWTYGTDYQFDCTSATDSVTLTGPPVGSLVSGNSNLLAFVVPSGSPQIFACGAIVSGNFTAGPSPSPPPQTTTWSTQAPVSTQETCQWTPGSVCVRDFFSANGVFNDSWDGSILFTDLGAGNTKFLQVQLFGSFGYNGALDIPVLINNETWLTWNYQTPGFGNCVDSTDSVTLKGNLTIPLVPSDANELSFGFPAGTENISACGAIISGSATRPSSTPSATSTATPSMIPVSLTPIPPTPSTNTTTGGSNPPPQTDSGMPWWGVALILATLVIVVSVGIIGGGAAFYHWRSKKLNEYAIMS